MTDSIWFNEKTWTLGEMTRRQVGELRGLIEEALARTRTQIETHGCGQYVDQDWLRRAESAAQYMQTDLKKIDAHLGRGKVRAGLNFKITGADEPVEDEFVLELADSLRGLEPGGTAVLTDNKEVISRIRSAMSEVSKRLGWRKVHYSGRFSYRTRVRDLPNNMATLTIYRFGTDKDDDDRILF